MGQQEYDNFKRLIKEWLDSHPNEYADFVEEMNDKKFKGFFNIFNTAVRLVPKYKEAADRKSTRLNSSHNRESRMPSSA